MALPGLLRPCAYLTVGVLLAATPTAAAAAVPADPPVGVTIVATPQDSDGSGATDSGDRIAYAVKISNDGDDTLTDVAVALDRNLGDAPCTTTTVAPGESVTCKPALPDYVFVADARAGHVTVHATLTALADGEPIEVTAARTTSVQARIGLAVSLDGDPLLHDVRVAVLDANKNGLADAGDQANYVLKVRNDGDYDFSRVTVTAPLITGAGGDYTCAFDGGLRVGGSETCYNRPGYVVTAKDEAAGGLTNTTTVRARVAGVPGNVDVVRRRSLTVTLDRTLENALTTTDRTTTEDVDGDGKVGEGDRVTFAFDLRNVGKRTLTSARATGEYVGAFTCAKRTLAPGAVTRCTARPFTVYADDVQLGGISTFVRVHADAGTAGTAWTTEWFSVAAG